MKLSKNNISVCINLQVSVTLTNGLVTVGCNMNKETLYMVRWQQKYPEWQELVDKHYDMLLEFSDMKEAKEVIERIKNGNTR